MDFLQKYATEFLAGGKALLEKLQCSGEGVGQSEG